jgi:hypothetical protein
VVWVAPRSEIERALRPQALRACEPIARAIRAAAQQLAANEARETGRYASTMTVRHDDERWYAVAPVVYAAPLEGGTGQYGPRRRKIKVDPNKVVLIGGPVVTARIREYRGIRGTHIMERAARQVAGQHDALRFVKRPWQLGEPGPTLPRGKRRTSG